MCNYGVVYSTIRRKPRCRRQVGAPAVAPLRACWFVFLDTILVHVADLGLRKCEYDTTALVLMHSHGNNDLQLQLCS